MRVMGKNGAKGMVKGKCTEGCPPHAWLTRRLRLPVAMAVATMRMVRYISSGVCVCVCVCVPSSVFAERFYKI